jgi:hypothetical protein
LEFFGVVPACLIAPARRAITYGCRPPSLEPAITDCIRKKNSGLPVARKVVLDK